MPIDASIPLQYRPPQFESPINKLAQVMQLQGMQDQQMERQVARDEQNRLKTLLANPTDDLGAALTRGGFLPQAQAYAKTQAEIAREKREAEKATREGEKATREGLKFDFDRTKGILHEVKSAVTALKSNPASTPEMAAQAALQIGQLFKMPEEQIRGMIAKIPQDPAAFRQYLDDEEKSMLTAEQRLTLFAPKLQAVPRGNVTDIMDLSGLSPTSGKTVQSVEMGLTPGERQRSEDTRRGDNMADARAKEANNLRREETNQPVDWKQDVNGNWVGLPKKPGDGPVTPITTTTPGKRETQARGVLDVIKEARTLLDSATGSYVGAGLDQAARAVGMSTRGAQSSAQLKALEGALMMAQPRMEGPQSNMDVQLYRQMAGQIGDATVPAKTKAAALDSIEKLNRKYANGSGPTGGATGDFGAPAKNAKGWALHTDAKGNRAYVSPDGKSFEEVR